MAAKRKASKPKPKKLEAASFVEVVTTSGDADERIEIEVDGAVVRVRPGFDPAELACVLEVLGRR